VNINNSTDTNNNGLSSLMNDLPLMARRWENTLFCPQTNKEKEGWENYCLYYRQNHDSEADGDA
jgi:hypothetical protein